MMNFRGRPKGNLVLCWSIEHFRDKSTISERLCSDVISWQAQYFEHGGGLRRALILWQGHVARFRKRGKSQATAAFWYLHVLFGSALVANHIGRAARCDS